MSAVELMGAVAPAGIKPARHLDETQAPIGEKVIAYARKHGLSAPTSIIMLTQPSSLGMAFNPLTVYYLSCDGEPTALLLEVRNTPWREREVYCIEAAGQVTRHRWQKTFHVSPFNPSGQTYDIHARWPDKGQVALDLSLRDEAGVLFRAGFRLAEVTTPAWSDRAGQWLMPWITVVGIYSQALRLWCRGLPYQPYPKELKKG